VFACCQETCGCSDHALCPRRYASVLQSCHAVLADLLQLHSLLMQRQPPVAPAPAVPAVGSKRGRDDADAADSRGQAAWREAEAAAAALGPFVDSALDKWHRRTVLSSGNAALRGATSLRALAQPVSVQVAGLLRNRHKLLQRTRLPIALAPRPLCMPEDEWRAVQGGGEGSAVAEDGMGGDQRDEESFDDGEFYQQLLKEFLEAKGAGGAAATSHGPKRRKVVDRRASKGRKLRYHVMDKLVGFCAPVERQLPPFAEQLFANLFA